MCSYKCIIPRPHYLIRPNHPSSAQSISFAPARQAFLTIVQQKSNRQIQTVFLFLQRSNTDKTDFDYLNYKCLNESIYSDNTDLVESNNKCLNESILNCDKTDFEFSNLNNKCLSKSVNSDNTDFSDLNNNCFNESIYNDNTDFGECSNESVNSESTDPD